MNHYAAWESLIKEAEAKWSHLEGRTTEDEKSAFQFLIDLMKTRCKAGEYERSAFIYKKSVRPLLQSIEDRQEHRTQTELAI